MENWGAITFHFSVIEKLPGQSFKKFFRDCRTLCHEISHMWFGNLVTLTWWSELWLNEGFARFMEFRCLDAVRKEYRAWFRFVTDVCYQALSVDYPLSNTHPVENPCVNPELIETYFDSISYQKGGSLLRMLEDLMGVEDFDEAVRRYLEKFKGKSVVSQDFFKVMEEYCKYPVQDIMETWTQQPGFPLVRVLRVGGNGFRIQQQPYDKQGQEIWKIPVRFITDTGEIDMVLLEERERLIETKNEIKWVKVNYGSRGFYRVIYDDYTEILQELRNMNAEDRYGIVNDVISHFNTGILDFSYVENVIDAIVPEFEYAIALLLCTFIRSACTSCVIIEYLTPLLNKILLPVWEKYGIRGTLKDPDFPEFKQLYCRDLLELCRNKSIAQEIRSEIAAAEEYTEFKQLCLLCLSSSQETIDCVRNDATFRQFILQESNDIDLLTFALQKELKLETKVEENTIIFLAVTSRAMKLDSMLVHALMLEYLDCSSDDTKQKLLDYVVIWSTTVSYFDTRLVELIQYSIEKIRQSKEKDINALNDCIISLQEKERYEGLDKYRSN